MGIILASPVSFAKIRSFTCLCITQALSSDWSNPENRFFEIVVWGVVVSCEADLFWWKELILGRSVRVRGLKINLWRSLGLNRILHSFFRVVHLPTRDIGRVTHVVIFKIRELLRWGEPMLQTRGQVWQIALTPFVNRAFLRRGKTILHLRFPKVSRKE